MKIKLIIIKVAMWQPWPHIGECKDSKISWWFYKRVGGVSFERNLFGAFWSKVWFKLLKKA